VTTKPADAVTAKTSRCPGSGGSGSIRRTPNVSHSDTVPPGRLYFRLRDVGGATIVQQAQHLFKLAMARRRVLLLIDEYTQVVEGQRTCGRPLDDVFTRGGGLGVGVIGNTQEPVLCPRKLLSQATHLYVFDLSFPADIAKMQEYIPDYSRPPREERHALWHVWLDGDAIPRYYPSLRAWRSQVVEGAT